MGTNYYWRYNLCTGCGRDDEAHVCKSGHTWQAYRNELLNAQHPEWGYTVESPFGRPIESVAGLTWAGLSGKILHSGRSP